MVAELDRRYIAFMTAYDAAQHLRLTVVIFIINDKALFIGEDELSHCVFSYQYHVNYFTLLWFAFLFIWILIRLCLCDIICIAGYIRDFYSCLVTWLHICDESSLFFASGFHLLLV